jgi:hypothetical protein
LREDKTPPRGSDGKSLLLDSNRRRRAVHARLESQDVVVLVEDRVKGGVCHRTIRLRHLLWTMAAVLETRGAPAGHRAD